jgi:hypothetical protein
VVDNIVLHLGFLNTPYTKKNMAAPVAAVKAHMAKTRRGTSRTANAEAVAGVLENRYGIVGTFLDVHQEAIDDIVTETFENYVIDAMSKVGKPTSAKMVKYMASRTNRIEKLFRGFLDREEMNGMAEGVPTQSALDGKRRGRKSRTPRPSFIDTGIYRASFRAWADIK